LLPLVSYSPLTIHGLFAVGRGSRRLVVISESGLYKLVMRSNKPEARKFQDWVTRDVLPAIRKDGGYIMGVRGRP
jgi:prophage antirepressor-like protein